MTKTAIADLLERVDPDLPNLNDIDPWGQDEYGFELPPYGPNAVPLLTQGFHRAISGIKYTPRNKASVTRHLSECEEKGYAARMDIHSGMIEVWVRKHTGVRKVFNDMALKLRQLKIFS